jgi:hypothetical protein
VEVFGAWLIPVMMHMVRQKRDWLGGGLYFLEDWPLAGSWKGKAQVQSLWYGKGYSGEGVIELERGFRKDIIAFDFLFHFTCSPIAAPGMGQGLYIPK